ncbi:MAG TPA: glycosyltransferase [Vicinamibacterales bacterium]|jgi:glycosyltransferase involved in cell wall biosynthesis|nr:glycosyltransferase [Vicinamibacterales bacterium]
MTTRQDPVKVLHVFGRLERGGAELRTLELAEAFQRDCVRSDFLVLSGLDGILDDRVEQLGGRVIKCRLDARFPGGFRRLLREGRYDVVHSHVHYFSGPILMAARLAGVRSRVAHFHTAIVNDRSDTRRRRAQLAVCRALLHRAATDIVAVGEGAMNAWSPRWPADPRCRIIPQGVRVDRLRRVERVRGRTPTVVNVASIQPLKNQLRLVNVLRRLVTKIPDVQVQLVGREVGDYGQQVRSAVASAGLSDHLTFVGEVNEPISLIASSHLMILPSLWEGVPCAVLEACAVGTPVLASDLPGTRELGRHFPHLQVLSLQQDDETWAAAAANLIRQEAPGAVEAEQFLARSPFVFDRSREAHYEIWRRSRALA